MTTFRDNWDNRVKGYDIWVTLQSANMGPEGEGSR